MTIKDLPKLTGRNYWLLTTIKERIRRKGNEDAKQISSKPKAVH